MAPKYEPSVEERNNEAATKTSRRMQAERAERGCRSGRR